MKKINKKLLPWLNGLATALLIDLIIPVLFTRGVPDFIWIGLTFLLPLISAVWLLYFTDRQPPKAVFKGFLVEVVIALVFSHPLGRMWGYGITFLGWDLFDFVAYCIQFIGFALGATVVQFVILWLMHKESKGGN
ncbi:MAG: hypothetical protein IJX04_08235 [Oscillospiraceae bacterium]|nr:hypothetical protein [Oscillospiraceae bacterium]